jgi:CheY-like chemotaxis protein
MSHDRLTLRRQMILNSPRPDAAWDKRERQLMKADALDRYVEYSLPKVINIAHGFGANDQIKGTVFVVEDEQSTGLSLQTILSSVRVAVVKATDSGEAISKLRNAHFDAVLLNINEPGTRGTDTCRRLRSVSPRLPIPMLGGSNDEEQVLRAFERKRMIILRSHSAISSLSPALTQRSAEEE